MNYQKYHDTLIDKAKDRWLDEYTERHHIIPKCLGGTDHVENLVDLTPEEHYVIHQLLVKLYPGNKNLVRSVHRMSSGSYKNPRNNKSYGWIRRKFSEANSGTGNPMAKLSETEVLEIYHSTKRTSDLGKQYNISVSQISNIKRKASYKSVVKHITDLPGTHPSIRRIPLSDETIRQIFLDEGDTAYFKEQYRVGISVVRNIKTKKTYKRATKGLNRPGQIALYGLLPHEVFAIKNSTKTPKALGVIYNTSLETIYNIQNNRTRQFTDVL